MKSYAAYFVKTADPAAARKALGSAVEVAGSPWLVCSYRKDASPPADDVLWGRLSLTQGQSKALGEVVFLFADNGTDSFVYEHARDGELLRKLVWFPMLDDDWTPGWLCAKGTGEEWEAALFRPERLPAVLEEEKNLLEEKGELGRLAEREAEVRKVWAERSIAGGGTVPRADWTVSRLVEDGLGLAFPAA